MMSEAEKRFRAAIGGRLKGAQDPALAGIVVNSRDMMDGTAKTPEDLKRDFEVEKAKLVEGLSPEDRQKLRLALDEIKQALDEIGE